MDDNLYERDFAAWIQSQAALLKSRNFEQLDLDNLIEEFECLIHTEQNLIKHHAYRLWYYLLTEKYEGFKDIRIKEWHESKAGYHHGMLESFLESPQMMEYFKNEYVDIYQHVRRNWCCDRGDWDLTLIPSEPLISLERFLEDGELFWLVESRKMEIKEGQVYRHYKNELYKVIAVATNSDDRTTEIVVYQNVNGGKVHWHYLSEFTTTVESGERRFKLEDDNEKR